MKNHHPDFKRRRLLQLLAAAPSLPWLPVTASPGAVTIRKAIPSSGEKIPVIGIGTSRVFEVGESQAERQGPLEALAALQRFDNAMIDTSPMYGEAEQVIGELLPLLPQPTKFFLATKVWTDGRQSGIDQMNASLRLLGTEQIDLMQIHNLVDWRTHIHTLRDWKAAGRIRYIGITHYHQGAHDDLADVIRQIPDLDFLQVNYSLMEPEAERQLLPMCADRGIAVIANRPFARGSWFSLTRGRKLPGWAHEMGIGSWAQFALKWTVSHPAIACAIPGTSKAKHMFDNMQAGMGELPNQAVRGRLFETAMET